MEENKKICIIIITKDNDIKGVEDSIKNLTENDCNNNEYVIATESKSNNIIDFCKKKEIKYFEFKNISEVYCNIPKQLEADYISFIEAGDTYSKGFRETLLTKLKNNQNEPLYIMPIIYDKKEYILNKNLKAKKNNKLEKVAIEKNPEKIWINIKSAVISRNFIAEFESSKLKNLKYYFEQNLLLKLIIKIGSYKIIRNTNLNSIRPLEDSIVNKEEVYDYLWYKNLLENINDLNKFSKDNYGNTPKFLQYYYMYMLKNVLNENANTKNKHILKDNLNKEFNDELKKILKNIDDTIIMNTFGNKLTNYYLMNLKYEDEETDYRCYENEICIMKNNNLIFNAQDNDIKILLMEYKDGNLLITARYSFPFDEKKLKIIVKYNEEEYKVTKNNLYSQYKVFGNPIFDEYTFDVKIPLINSSEKKYIEFFVQSGEECKVKLDLNFQKPLSKLTKSRAAYWTCGNFSLNYRKKSIMVLNNTKMRHLKRELKYITVLMFNKDKNARKAGRLRLIYDLTKKFFRKEIWLFEDKIFKGGDNGEYMYTYATSKNDGIKKYYVLSKGTIDAKRFKQEKKKFVNYGSLKHKLLFLNCDILFETHNSAAKHHAFDVGFEKYFRDLFNSTNVCIQHGLSVQYIPHLINRINDNLKLFFLASPVEKKNLDNKEYAYEGHKDILKITGCPRYDGLKNNDLRQILITPTWRNYLAIPASSVENGRERNNNFKKSDYFKIYNSLINNKKLIETANKTGYKIVYLLHPCTSPQIDDFDKNDDVELIAATEDLNYEKILTESSLMVTDYSGVQFDFAYMYKPIVYFHPDKLPPSYDEGEYKYETMALGEIVKDSNKLVDLLCEYMQNDCKIKKDYKKRIDKFFKYHDYNNCERIYNEIMKYRDGGNNGNSSC